MQPLYSHSPREWLRTQSGCIAAAYEWLHAVGERRRAGVKAAAERRMRSPSKPPKTWICRDVARS
jgi:hypothetical protein